MGTLKQNKAKELYSGCAGGVVICCHHLVPSISLWGTGVPLILFCTEKVSTDWTHWRPDKGPETTRHLSHSDEPRPKPLPEAGWRNWQRTGSFEDHRQSTGVPQGSQSHLTQLLETFPRGFGLEARTSSAREAKVQK